MRRFLLTNSAKSTSISLIYKEDSHTANGITGSKGTFHMAIDTGNLQWCRKQEQTSLTGSR